MDYARRMAKRFAPAAERNKQPLLEVLRRVLPSSGTVLELASGTGQHAAFFAAHLPALTWQPSDPSPDALSSIEAWVSEQRLENLLPPLALDVRSRDWPIYAADAVLCVNMIHIAPFEASEGLFAGASRILAPDAPLVTYGPYRLYGEHTAPSNAAFDASLRSRDPTWGVRDIDELSELATRTGFELRERIMMPANNMTLAWVRRA